MVGSTPASGPGRPFSMCYIFWSGGTAGPAPDGKGFADLALRGDHPSATHLGLTFTHQEGVNLPRWTQDSSGTKSRMAK